MRVKVCRLCGDEYYGDHCPRCGETKTEHPAVARAENKENSGQGERHV